MSGRHLTDEEIVERVFPSREGPAPVPLHLAVCADCQRRVGRLREAQLLDRGALDGAVESLPEEFWTAQRGAVMREVNDLGERAASVRPFPVRLGQTLFRRPVLALGSAAAALLLVASITVSHTRPATRAAFTPAPQAAPTAIANASQTAHPASVAPADRADDELLRSIDTVLAEDAPHSTLIPEEI